MEPTVVAAVGTASSKRSNTELGNAVQDAMSKAVETALAEGIPISDTETIRQRMMDARAAVHQRVAEITDTPPEPVAPPKTLGEVASEIEAQRILALQSSALMEEILRVLLGTDRSVAIGAAAAFLLKAATDNPGQLQKVLLGTEVENLGRRCSIWDAIRSTINAR